MSQLSNSLLGLALCLPLISQAQTCQTAGILATTPTAQFTVHDDGTVTDSATGLMWKQCPEGQSGADCATGSAQGYTWQAALQQAASVNVDSGFAGYSDWRLPNIKELRSIVERQCFDPSINLTVFPSTDSSWWFWSSSPVAANSNYAWYVDFNGGYLNWGNKNNVNAVRLVRSGQ